MARAQGYGLVNYLKATGVGMGRANQLRPWGSGETKALPSVTIRVYPCPMLSASGKNSGGTVNDVTTEAWAHSEINGNQPQIQADVHPPAAGTLITPTAS